MQPSMNGGFTSFQIIGVGALWLLNYCGIAYEVDLLTANQEGQPYHLVSLKFNTYVVKANENL
ncbi:hypothetical protein Ahy_A09g041991 isoform E [Arachis hypogaea]|uniref:Uncharacterized protein n=1 Tax=Arachis hypogaea TaxID=3818 RepID=A0A445BEG4_ARAHY|nr:hypothetical protein Ahy_A09g041991 isoform E [Arachis hypogaea]